MHKAYKDYYWKDGKPYGRELTSSLSGITFRIVIDPYHARYSLEEYEYGKFKRLIYDSAFFDFRHLRRPEHATWQKELLTESTTLIRNHDDRVILTETYEFENTLCRTCRLSTANGLLLSTHRLYYESLGDKFNGVILYDTNNKPILKKTYTFDSDSQAFTDLIQESWEV